MGQIGDILSFGLKARLEGRSEKRIVVELLTEKMDGVDRAVRRPTLKERLGLKGLGCCGATWGLGPTNMSVRDGDDEEEEDVGIGVPILSPQIAVISATQNPVGNGPSPPCAVQSQAPTAMNLAAALAAERQLRAMLDSADRDIFGPNRARPINNEERSPTAPAKVSLMRLLEETDGEMKKAEDGEGCGSVCCVCMGTKKGAAFIPCGHTFCRVCSRELWLNRGSCPLCNRPILEILHIIY